MTTTIDDAEMGEMHEGKDPRRGRAEQTLEVCVFVFLILPGLLLSFVSVGSAGLDFVLGGISIIFRDLALVSLVLFFLWRNREPVRRIGMTFRGRSKDVALGVVLFVPMFYAAGWVEQAAQAAGLSPGPKSLPAALVPQSSPEFVLAAVMTLVVAFAEEIIFRGYLILRLRAATNSVPAAVILATAIFALGHGYEGTAGVVTVGFMGLVFAGVYWWRQSLVAPMVMHFLQDFLGIVVAPLVGAR